MKQMFKNPGFIKEAATAVSAAYVQVVEQTEGDSKQHVYDAQDHGHLHLERVQESQLVGGNIPNLQKRQNRVTIRIIFNPRCSLLLFTSRFNTAVITSPPPAKYLWCFNERAGFTGSIPRGYGPLKTPGTAGSNWRTAFPSRVSNLWDKCSH